MMEKKMGRAPTGRKQSMKRPSPLLAVWEQMRSKPAREVEPSRAGGQMATRELQASKEEETERDSSLAEVDAETDAIRMKRRGCSGRESHALLLPARSQMQVALVESTWKRSNASKDELRFQRRRFQ
ncbi:uncharacterized protein MONOS_15530 [Monocercomonoides exilis]|uniref:uncharacterized protein n=1 Tax=Monocercomonoides exilis TaxID=2049356 RepID=UPI00355A5B3C|nr:hypothetical protein MONOS_15530 [Monocercomonoides exilis]|eukprot:MONOS_15530.1-p1 / transcript=MONOS_15530.1 / gene=MONOS_15530 / organism=Monocercomonoides_exilis_PA203 / gene_product=unspecified product / transcript_product=unspecified product / location=Mono_scaffold01264:5245-5818(-) / protein_length=127 / sequence_SO=supercontig / SO=protein_coding / is_pseudo=false